MACQIKMMPILRACCLFVGCLATGMAYSMDAFNIFSESLKRMFQYSQSEIELIISLANVGLLASLPAGLLLQYLGFRILSFIGLVITTGSYLLLWSATFNVQYYRDNFFLVAIYFLLSGAGGGIMYITATTVNVRNYDIRYLGLVSGLIHSVKSVILGLLFATYDAFFATPLLTDQIPRQAPLSNSSNISESAYVMYRNISINSTVPSDSEQEIDDLGGYFMFVAVMYAATNILAILIYGDYYPDDSIVGNDSEKQALLTSTSPDSQRQSKGVLSGDSGFRSDATEDDLLSSSSIPSSNKYQTIKDEKQPVVHVEREEHNAKSPLDLVKSFNYHAILWPSALMIAYRTCYINNLTVFLLSMNLEMYKTSLVFLIPILGTLLKPCIGVASDVLVKRVPRFGILLLFLTLESITCVLCIFLLGSVDVVALGLITAIFGSCTVQTLSPALVVEFFGKDCFAYGWGFVTLMWSLGTLMLQMLYGWLYDAQVAPGVLDCYGTRCFYQFFTICACLTLLASLLLVIACFKTLRQN